MALITRSSNASIDVSTAQFAPQIADLVAGEDIDIAAPCYLKTSDGKAWMSNATSADEAAEIVGFAGRAAKSGQKVTLFGHGTRFRYSDGLLSPGAPYYTGATKGRLDDGATTGCAFPVAQAINASDIRIVWDSTPLTSATVGAGTISATELANNAVTTAKILAANVTEAKIEVGAASAGLSGLVAKFVADDQVIGGLPVIHPVIIAAGATGAKNITLTHKTRVIDAWVVLKGAGVLSCTLTIGNAGNAITDAMDVSGSDTAVVRAATINDANYEIAAGGSLRVTTAAGATQPDCIVFVLGYRVA